MLHNFGRSSFNIGFLFALIGLIFVVYFSFQLNWKIIFAGKDDFRSTTATVTEFHETQYTLNDNTLFEYHYRYTVPGRKPFSGSFLEYSGAYRNGQDIRIEYLENDPGISRFSGKDRRNYDKVMFLAGVGGLLVGFSFLYPSCRKTRRERKILIAGLPSRGRLIHAEPTNLKINEQTVYNLTYEYETYQGKSQKFSLRSHMIRNLSEEHTENLVYDPGHPDKAVVVDTLPGSVARYVSSKIGSQDD